MAKSKYETYVLPYLDKIEGWVRQGADIKEIADNLHVAYSTLRKYLDDGEKGDERYSALSALFVRACEEPNDQVKASLYKLACGYTVKVVKHYKVKRVEYDKKTGRKIREIEELIPAEDEVHVPANVTAQMFWLANRDGTNWKYKPDGSEGEDGEEGGVVQMPAVMDDPGPPPLVQKEAATDA